jgi:hypothetical protein
MPVRRAAVVSKAIAPRARRGSDSGAFAAQRLTRATVCA